MRLVNEIRHPLLLHKLNSIRNVNTKGSEIKKLLEEIATVMVYEALRDLPTRTKRIETWIGEREFEFIREEKIVFVPVLRAGLPMLEGALRAVPNAKVGFLAIKRNESTLEAKVYYSRLPDLKGTRVLILDPMLATGGTLVKAIEEISKDDPAETVSLHVVCAPEGIEKVRRSFSEHRIYTVSMDECLNDKGYIIPGLGDMGDRLYS